MFFGTTVTVTVVRVVDGDTLRIGGGLREESVRLLALDTEESNAGSNKPITPWGREAKKEAERFFSPGDTVTLEFPGHEPPEECWVKHRDNYGRVLGFIHKNGQDFQEHMIREGYSPYFVKYGYADFEVYHHRYMLAERDAQAAHRGLWDQVTVNGSEMRNYALLGVWWHLRAQIIDQYRLLKQANPDLLNSRLDYAQLVELATQEPEVTVFTELREYHQVGSSHVIITIGSIQQPFQVFLPNAINNGQPILHLLDNRYIAVEPDHVRRNYAYVRGLLKLYQGKPEIIVTSPEQITDWPVTS
jgi:micrococcal nuclease